MKIICKLVRCCKLCSRLSVLYLYISLMMKLREFLVKRKCQALVKNLQKLKLMLPAKNVC